MTIFLLTVIKTDWQDGDISRIEFAGKNKQQCLEKAFEDLCETKIKYLVKEDEDFKLDEENFIELLNYHGPSSENGFDDFEWTEMKITKKDVKIVPNR